MQKQVHGGDIYSKSYKLDFSTNINPFGMPDSVRGGAQKGVALAIHYPDVEYRELKEAISITQGVAPEHIICGNGAAEVIFGLVLAKRPKTALLIAPGFAEYEQALKTVDCDISFYHCKRESGYLVEADYLHYLEQKPEIVFLCNPNNPTGALIEDELLNQIIDICKKNNTLLVLDECFLDFVAKEKQNSKKGRMIDVLQLFILKAFTKMYGMPGLRLGYGMCSDTELLSKMKQVLQPWNVSMPAQYAGIAALKEDEFVNKTRKYVQEERVYMIEELKKIGFTIYDSQANYIFFEGPENLFDVCDSEGILIRDCSNYRNLHIGCYRVAVRLREENEQLLAVLRAHYQV